MAAKNKPNEIHLSRIYDAPVETVWEAWTDPKQVAKWWGPRGFTLTTHSKDLKPGGHWHYTMHGPDGTDYPNRTQYYEVEKYVRLVYDHGANENQPALFRVTVVFTDLKGKTKMDMTMALATPEAAAQTKQFIRQAKGNSTWDRLAEYLEKEQSGREIFVMNHSIEAPIQKVQALWKEVVSGKNTTKVEFAKEGEDQTLVTITLELPKGEENQRAAMTDAWDLQFHKIEDLLKTPSH